MRLLRSSKAIQALLSRVTCDLCKICEQRRKQKKQCHFVPRLKTSSYEHQGQLRSINRHVEAHQTKQIQFDRETELAMHGYATDSANATLELLSSAGSFRPLAYPREASILVLTLLET